MIADGMGVLKVNAEKMAEALKLPIGVYVDHVWSSPGDSPGDCWLRVRGPQLPAIVPGSHTPLLIPRYGVRNGRSEVIELVEAGA